MPYSFLIAAVLAILVGIVHSVLGEFLIFRRLRDSGMVPSKPAPPLGRRHIQILWATWHFASVFGFACAAILFALHTEMPHLNQLVVHAVAISFAVGSLLVLGATRGRHPGWIGLLAVALLTWVA